MRLIDADLIDYNCLIFMNEFNGVSVNNIISGYKKLVNNQQTFNEWIPCSERLPLDSGWYMASCVDNDGYEFVKICSFHKSIDEEFSFFDAFSNVIAWRPLPQPYKEEIK